MGWSRWSCPFFFFLLLILLPLSLELELQPIEEVSSRQCPRYQPGYPNLAVDQCYHSTQPSFVQDREKVLAELQTRIKKELIADLGAAIQSTLQHLMKMIVYPPPENGNNEHESPIIEPGPARPANDNNDDGRRGRPKISPYIDID